MEIQLAKWDAIELFVRTIAKYEGKLGDKEYLNMPIADIKAKLVNYSGRGRSGIMSNFIFGLENRRPSIFSTFCKQITLGEPVILTQENFIFFKRYIENEKFAETTLIETKELDLTNTARELENTQWWLYFYDEEFLSTSDHLCHGISKATLILKSFCKAELTISINDNTKTRVYKGLYDVTHNSEHLTFDMKTEKRTLKLSFNISDNFNFALGLAFNRTTRLLAKRVIIEQSLEQNISPKFYDFETAINNLPNYIIQYLRNKDENFLSMPEGNFFSAKAFNKYLNPTKT